jgi:arylsulfatase A-like enzyme
MRNIVALLSLALFATVAGGQTARPNIIFVLVDDLGWADLGCYGSRFHQTPNLDRLAAQGVRLTSAYAAGPVCSPSRVAMLTGLHPQRLGITDWLGGSRTGLLNPPPLPTHLPAETVTIGAALAEAGYATGYFGKWDLGGAPFAADRFGFGVNLGGTGKSTVPHQPPYGLANLPDGPRGEFIGDRLTNEAIAFMRANQDKPFFVYLSHFDVHNPPAGRAELVARYRQKAAESAAPAAERFRKESTWNDRRVQDDPVYAAMVEMVDENMGRLLAAVDELKLAGRTLVVFTGDNGGLSTAEGSPTSNAPLRCGKGWLYEGGVREPLIVRWAGGKAGAICDVPVTSVDFVPTLLELAGIAAKPGMPLDGISMAGLLRGEAGDANRPIFWHYPHYANQGGWPAAAVRAGDWKLLEFFEDHRVELYNLKEDIGEQRNLSAGNPGKTQELLGLLHQWQERVKAAMPTGK